MAKSNRVQICWKDRGYLLEVMENVEPKTWTVAGTEAALDTA